ncbi:thiaminase II [Nesterenkonia flava]|uniref:Aminopyrimidine aminohydrolase n=1 Tax=Nesterenkonia flava TaxID=469799 RepID=A0ABU1FVJ7_9MICC|nr:thiaminase II [Nesterenkonia flava]MDR5712693.1 thiaminase II [Nesterenkonia flava]
MGTLFDRLKDAAAQEWAGFTDHRFIQQMEDGSLPEEAFRQYLIQDYLFLIQFARAYALAAYKSRTMADIRAAQDGLAAIVAETELHVRLCEGWGISRQALDAAPEHETTVAYTRYVLDAGSSGDLLDLHVALSPCVVGYAEIGRRLKPALEQNPKHPYGEWISEYSGAGYLQTAQAAVAHIEELARRSFTEARFEELAQHFATATRLEGQFWQMGLDLGAAD